MAPHKGPEKDAANKLRDDYEKIVDRPVSPKARKEIEEMLKSQKPKATNNRPKKIAKNRQDAEV
ncbi:MAG TPA: hypothetical protein PL182_07730 [Pseudobdellovibrionaceae bacterium]|nr:hypothetical protein [Pseudobdellovibrionaceae bacterium]